MSYQLRRIIDNIWVNEFVICNQFDKFRYVITFFSHDTLLSILIILYQFLVLNVAAQRLCS